MTTRTLVYFTLLASLGASACSAPVDFAEAEAEGLESSKSPIIDGDPIPEMSPFVLVDNNCSGTLLAERTVLTAKHCVETQVNTPATISLHSGTTDTVAQTVMVHPTLDVAVVRSVGAFPKPNSSEGGTFWPSLYTGTMADLNGDVVDCYGYGYNTYNGGFGTLRRGDNLLIGTITATGYRVSPGVDGEIMWRGDSGGSCYLRNNGNLVVTGVQSTSTHSPALQQVLYATHVGIPAVRSWLQQTQTFSNPKINGYGLALDAATRERFCAQNGFASVSGHGGGYVSGSTIFARWNGAQWVFEPGDSTPPISNIRATSTLTCARI